MPADWYAPMRAVRSLGSQAKRPGSLAGLHQARQEHLSQFFTGDDLAQLVWRIAVEGPSQGLDRRISVLDNSVGAGRLLQFADPVRHMVAGVDIHEPTIAALMDAADAADLEADFVALGMEAVEPKGFDVAVANPPFSLRLDSPTLTPYSCTTWGAFGANTAAVSHAYAVHQALGAADVVAAILPASYAAETFANPTPEMDGRLRALVELPRGCFAREGTDVRVSLLVFGPDMDRAPTPQRIQLDDLGRVPLIPGLHLTQRHRSPRPLSGATVEAARPSITGEVTGDPHVRIVHNGRHVSLKAGCAFMRAKVLNRVLREPVMPMEGHRYPKGVRFTGQGRLDVELWLLQPDPMACLAWLEEAVRACGGIPAVDDGLRGYLRRRIRQHAVASTPYGHWVAGQGQSAGGKATVTRKRLLDPTKWGSALLQVGDQVEVELRPDGDYSIRVGDEQVTLRPDAINADFDLPAASVNGWREAHPTREARFPALVQAIRAHLDACGASKVISWDYQIEDAAELLLGRHGFSAWRMGCGKGRLGIALALAGGKHNAIVVEARLIDELVQQLRESGVDPGLWQVITRPEHCSSLRKINIVSYSRLRQPVAVRDGAAGRYFSRRTYAHLLRRRFSLCCADEAQCLRNSDTDQSRALAMLSPRRRFGMSGTPMANMVQSLLPPLAWAFGDGTALQPFGRHRAFLEARLWTSMDGARRGVDEFSDRHLVLEWVTRSFEDGLLVGAKRQVPRIAKVGLLREWAAPLLKRRHELEPKVAAHFSTPTPKITHTELAWDRGHLAHYLTVADEFVDWYRAAMEKANGRGQNLNLVALLARIGAVEKACNIPQFVSQSKVAVPVYGRLTSKQRHVLRRLEEWTGQGHKSICYADSPTAVNLYVRELHASGIEAVPFHGQLPIVRRTKDLNRRFRWGDAPVLVASKECAENGLNLWQASRGIFAARDWSHTTEEQLMRRLLRPQQTQLVEFEFVNLQGSIDCYQNQMTQLKGESAEAALDFLEPASNDEEFVHLDRILAAFVDDMAKRFGYEGHDFRKLLRDGKLAA